MALPKINTPTYTMTVPSTGEQVSYRPYLVKEEKILMMAMETQDQRQMLQAIKQLISACTSGSVDVDKLTTFDIEYVFTKLRAKSVGEVARVEAPCESCEGKNEVEVNLDSDVQITGATDRDMNIPLTGDVGLIMKFPNVNDVMDNLNTEADEFDQLLAVMVACIDSVYQGDQFFDIKGQSKQEIDEFIGSLSNDQFTKIREFFDEMPQTTAHLKFKCQSCGADNDIELKGLVNFFT
jgi:hypothetical protein